MLGVHINFVTLVSRVKYIENIPGARDVLHLEPPLLLPCCVGFPGLLLAFVGLHWLFVGLCWPLLACMGFLLACMTVVAWFLSVLVVVEVMWPHHLV